MKRKKPTTRRKKRRSARKQELRNLILPVQGGLREAEVPGSRQASTVGRLWNAIHRHVETGDSSALKEFEGKKIRDAQGIEIPLLTDIDEIDRLASAGVLSFESIYARSS